MQGSPDVGSDRDSLWSDGSLSVCSVILRRQHWKRGVKGAMWFWKYQYQQQNHTGHSWTWLTFWLPLFNKQALTFWWENSAESAVQLFELCRNVLPFLSWINQTLKIKVFFCCGVFFLVWFGLVLVFKNNVQSNWQAMDWIRDCNRWKLYCWSPSNHPAKAELPATF